MFYGLTCFYWFIYLLALLHWGPTQVGSGEVVCTFSKYINKCVIALFVDTAMTFELDT